MMPRIDTTITHHFQGPLSQPSVQCCPCGADYYAAERWPPSRPAVYPDQIGLADPSRWAVIAARDLPGRCALFDRLSPL